MNLKEHIIKEFGSRPAQQFYIEKAEEGLWPPEEVLIKKYFKPKSQILDIGCGTGRTTIPLFKQGYKITAIDLTPEMIENAKEIAGSKKLKVNYKIGDATSLKFKDNSFDNALFSNNGWTQISGRENRLKALTEIHRVLKPGGIFIFTTHVRTLKGYFWFWLGQWIKIYILKPLRFPVDEEEWGDRFFKKENSSAVPYPEKQYIHIPTAQEVKNEIEISGLKLIYNEMGKNIAKTDKYFPMFYVCKKQPSIINIQRKKESIKKLLDSYKRYQKKEV